MHIRYRLVPRTLTGADAPIQVGFSPGRAVRNKPTRNRIKRVMREVWRTQGHALLSLFEARDDSLTFFVLFRGSLATADAAIRRDLPQALDRLEGRLRAQRTMPR